MSFADTAGPRRRGSSPPWRVLVITFEQVMASALRPCPETSARTVESTMGAATGVHDGSGEAASAPLGGGQSVCDELGAHVSGDRRADQAVRSKVDDRRQVVQLPVLQREIGKSPTYIVFGSVTVKPQPIRSGAFALGGSAAVVQCLRRSRMSARPMLRMTRAIRRQLTRSPPSRSSAVILATPQVPSDSRCTTRIRAASPATAARRVAQAATVRHQQQ